MDTITAEITNATATTVTPNKITKLFRFTRVGELDGESSSFIRLTFSLESSRLAE